MHIEAICDSFDLGPLAASIRRSSNFRFAWQFYSVFGADLNALATTAEILRVIITQPSLHFFLANSLDDIYPRKFQIEPLHEHATIVRGGASFLDTMARASLDRLGAYSRELSPSTADEGEPIHKLFSRMGQYSAFTIEPGRVSTCTFCQQPLVYQLVFWCRMGLHFPSVLATGITVLDRMPDGH
jgi:hypothetical protein